MQRGQTANSMLASRSPASTHAAEPVKVSADPAAFACVVGLVTVQAGDSGTGVGEARSASVSRSRSAASPGR